MRLESKKLLYDVQQACARIADFTREKSWSHFAADSLLRSAVERQFEIIGGALSQLQTLDIPTLQKISRHERFIIFRNVLVSGCGQMNDAVTWRMIRRNLPDLMAEVEIFLEERQFA
jgi:uncharacterized protein with HEPN domain